jgi:hypothetical protein
MQVSRANDVSSEDRRSLVKRIAGRCSTGLACASRAQPASTMNKIGYPIIPVVPYSRADAESRCEFSASARESVIFRPVTRQGPWAGEDPPAHSGSCPSRALQSAHDDVIRRAELSVCASRSQLVISVEGCIPILSSPCIVPVIHDPVAFRTWGVGLVQAIRRYPMRLEIERYLPSQRFHSHGSPVNRVGEEGAVSIYDCRRAVCLDYG